MKYLVLTALLVLALVCNAWAGTDTAGVTLSVGGWDTIEIDDDDDLGAGDALTLAFAVVGGADSDTCDTAGYLDWDSNYTTISVTASYTGDGTLKAWNGTAYEAVATALDGTSQSGEVDVTSWELSGLSGFDAGTAYGGTLTCSISGS